MPPRRLTFKTEIYAIVFCPEIPEKGVYVNPTRILVGHRDDDNGGVR